MPARPVIHIVRNARDSPLWQVINDTFPKLVDYVRHHDQHVPSFVERELEAFLACGQIDRGFTHIRCASCDARQLVPFTCKSRSLCPSCCGRRMNQTSLHLVESVIPHVPVRQWVLTFPAPLRYLLAYDTELCSKTVALFVHRVMDHYRFVLAREQNVDVARLQGGTVTSIQRAGSALQASLHLHCIALDGAYLVDDPGPPRFFAAPRVTPVEIQAVAWDTCQAVMGMLRKRGLDLTGDGDDSLDRLAEEYPLLARCLSASQQGVVAVGDDAGRRLQRGGYAVEPVAANDSESAQQTPGYGFNLHAGRRVPACDRRGLERLCRYVLSPPVSADRVTRLPDGRVAYRLKRRWSDGTSVVYFSALDFVSKLMALIPRPRVHLIRYHGCLAPRSKLRRQVVPKPPRSSPRSASSRGHDGPQLRLFDRGPAPRWIARAELLEHVFGTEASPRCQVCGSGRLEVVSVVRRWDAICAVLDGFNLSFEGRVLTRIRGPPWGQLELGLFSPDGSLDRQAA